MKREDIAFSVRINRKGFRDCGDFFNFSYSLGRQLPLVIPAPKPVIAGEKICKLFSVDLMAFGKAVRHGVIKIAARQGVV